MIDQLINEVLEGADPASVLEVRAIRIDKGQIAKTSKAIMKDVVSFVKRLPADKQIGTHTKNFLKNHSLLLRTVDGRGILVRILAAFEVDSHNADTINNAAFGKSSSGPVIVVYFNGDNTAKGFLTFTSVIERKLFNILIHEVTHAKDIPGDPGYKVVNGQPVGGFKAYINDPKEIRANMQEIVDQAIEFATTNSRWPKLVKMMGSPNKAFGTVLNNSTTWSTIKGDLTPANRKKIMQAVHTAFRDEGLI